MKQFITTNWYRLTTGTALLIFAFAFLIFVLQNNVDKADNSRLHNQTVDQNKWIVANVKEKFEVKRQKSCPYL